MIQADIKRDLSSMLQPRSIALIGATDRSTWSKATFANLTTRKCGGQVHLIARRGGIVHGRQAATSCVTLGEKIDLGLLMVPAAGIEEAMADLGAAGARNAVILSSGFAETGQQGAESQQKLAAPARRYNISLLGPNCPQTSRNILLIGTRCSLGFPAIRRSCPCSGWGARSQKAEAAPAALELVSAERHVQL